MIKCVGLSSEHTQVPNRLLLSSESTDRNRYTYSWDLDKEHSFNIYCTYAWFETDEIDISSLPDFCDNQIPIAVMDYKPKYSKRTIFIFEDPIWDFIEEACTPEIQRWIEQNLERINELFIAFAKSNGYLEKV